MDNFTAFWDKYGGAVVGLIVGILAAVLIFFTNLYKVVFALALVAVCVWLGAYIQRNKETVKEKTKEFIDKL